MSFLNTRDMISLCKHSWRRTERFASIALLFPAPSERLYNQCDVYGFAPCRRRTVEINTPSSSTAAYLQRPLRGNDVGGVHEHQQPMITLLLLLMMMMMRTMLEMQLPYTGAGAQTTWRYLLRRRITCVINFRFLRAGDFRYDQHSSAVWLALRPC